MKKIIACCLVINCFLLFSCIYDPFADILVGNYSLRYCPKIASQKGEIKEAWIIKYFLKENNEYISRFSKHYLSSLMERISKWAKEVTELQGKRTLQDKDWKFIVKKMQKE